MVFETGDKAYYWLNNIVAVGVLRQVEQEEEVFVLRIDVWHVTLPWIVGWVDVTDADGVVVAGE